MDVCFFVGDGRGDGLFATVKQKAWNPIGFYGRVTLVILPFFCIIRNR